MPLHVDRLYKHPNYESVPGYWSRHERAILAPQGSEAPVVGMLKSWLTYADVHRERFESGIGEDYVLGPEWAKIGVGLLGLLNGECGRLDCGTVDSIIRATLKAEGLGPEDV